LEYAGFYMGQDYDFVFNYFVYDLNKKWYLFSSKAYANFDIIITENKNPYRILNGETRT